PCADQGLLSHPRSDQTQQYCDVTSSIGQRRSADTNLKVQVKPLLPVGSLSLDTQVFRLFLQLVLLASVLHTSAPTSLWCVAVRLASAIHDLGYQRTLQYPDQEPTLSGSTDRWPVPTPVAHCDRVGTQTNTDESEVPAAVPGMFSLLFGLPGR